MAPLRTGAAAQGDLTASLLERLRNCVQHVDSDAGEPPPGHRRAAVLLLFDTSSPGLPLLFMLRSEQLRFHAGQISFPGGTSEASDADDVATALREAREEVGLEPSNVEVIGRLSPFVTAVSERWLTPIVALQRNPWTVRGDDNEVAEWFRIELADLLVAPHTLRAMERDGRSRMVHFYEVQGRIIWGVTAAIVHELMHCLGRAD